MEIDRLVLLAGIKNEMVFDAPYTYKFVVDKPKVKIAKIYGPDNETPVNLESRFDKFKSPKIKTGRFSKSERVNMWSAELVDKGRDVYPNAKKLGKSINQFKVLGAHVLAIDDFVKKEKPDVIWMWSLGQKGGRLIKELLKVFKRGVVTGEFSPEYSINPPIDFSKENWMVQKLVSILGEDDIDPNMYFLIKKKSLTDDQLKDMLIAVENEYGDPKEMGIGITDMTPVYSKSKDI